MIILFTFISLLGGLAYGIFGFHIPAVSLILKNTDGVLYALMFFVGISIGMHRGILSKIREYHIKIFIIPAGIIAGSIVGGIICSLLLKIPVGQGTAIASGMGWYSLAGVTIGNLAGAQLGSIAFLSNLMREIISFFLIPPISRRLNYYTCIAPAAATSDTAWVLPRYCTFMEERDTLPFTGQQPTAAAAIFPAAQARIS